MNALNESARIVDNAWCKGDMRKEAESADAGDTYCAVGAMIHTFATARGYDVDWLLEDIGHPDQLSLWNKEVEKWRNEISNSESDRRYPNRKQYEVFDFMQFIADSLEGKLLAKAIIENFSDRLAYDLSDAEDYASEVIVSFNDHKDTTREEVVAMMEKAAAVFDEQVGLEDKTTDDLVAEIDAMLVS